VSNRHVKTRRSVDGKLIDLVFTPFHEQSHFTLEACGDDGGLNVHGNLPHCSLSDSVLARDLLGEMGFINSLWELAEKSDNIWKVVGVRRYNPLSPSAFYLVKGLTSTSSRQTGSCSKSCMPHAVVFSIVVSRRRGASGDGGTCSLPCTCVVDGFRIFASTYLRLMLGAHFQVLRVV
jgi:hypothetical protein